MPGGVPVVGSDPLHFHVRAMSGLGRYIAPEGQYAGSGGPGGGFGVGEELARLGLWGRDTKLLFRVLQPQLP